MRAQTLIGSMSRDLLNPSAGPKTRFKNSCESCRPTVSHEPSLTAPNEGREGASLSLPRSVVADTLWPWSAALGFTH